MKYLQTHFIHCHQHFNHKHYDTNIILINNQYSLLLGGTGFACGRAGKSEVTPGN